MHQQFNLVGVIRLLIQWWKQILWISLGSALLVGLFSWFFMDDYFLSYATFYPINMAQNDRVAMFNTENAVALDYYGTKEDINRMLTIAQSGEVAAYVIEKYQLAAHYKIDTNKRYWRTKVKKEFESNYKAIKTDQSAVEISILDTDPKLAAEIVNDILGKVDATFRHTILEAKQKQLELIKNQLNQQASHIAAMNDSLADLTRDFHIVVRAGADKSEIVEGSDFRAVQLYKTLSSEQRNAITEYNNRTNIKEQMEVSMQSNASAIAVVDKPVVADRKEKPVRSLIVLSTFLITLVMSVFGVLLMEQVNAIRKEL
ncbi:MAG: hypothetical protein U0T84_03775 [Chitinophagales bacterium]